jgi:GNAT superfamily N-acetyltransferase
MTIIRYDTVSGEREVEEILELQARNHVSAVSSETMRDQGFVTVRYEPAVLADMSRRYPQVIARAGDALAGYCLVLPQSFRRDVPILAPMFALLDGLSWRGRPLRDDPRWFVMGQVCVAEAYRGQGVFDGLYEKLREVCRPDFDFVVTEVAARNVRSLRAHRRVGFQTLHTYDDPTTGEQWEVIVWDWTD